MVGRYALQKLGSSLLPKDLHYLAYVASTDEAYVTDSQRDIIYLNANGHPFFQQVWEMEQKNIGETASPQALLELTAFDYIQHLRNGFWLDAYGDEFNIKFLVRIFHLEGGKVINNHV